MPRSELPRLLTGYIQLIVPNHERVRAVFATSRSATAREGALAQQCQIATAKECLPSPLSPILHDQGLLGSRLLSLLLRLSITLRNFFRSQKDAHDKAFIVVRSCLL